MYESPLWYGGEYHDHGRSSRASDGTNLYPKHSVDDDMQHYMSISDEISRYKTVKMPSKTSGHLLRTPVLQVADYTAANLLSSSSIPT